MRKLTLLSTFLLFAAMGCESATAPGDDLDALSPALFGAMSGPLGETSGGALFLPPLGSAPSGAGASDPAADPVVEVCEDAACSVLHVRFDAEGSGPDRVRTASDGSHHMVNWNTGETGAVPGSAYWIRVLVGGEVAGAIEIVVGANGTFRRGGGDVAGLVAGQTLPIRFRVEARGAGPSVELLPASVEVALEDGVQLEAIVRDATGAVIVGAEVTWTTDRSDLVFLLTEPFELWDGTTLLPGYVVGAAPGEARVTASYGGASASSVVTVVARACEVRPSGSVRFGNLSPESPVVDVAVDGEPLGLRLAFGTVSDYMEVSGCAYAFVDADAPETEVGPLRTIFPAVGTGTSNILVGATEADSWDRIYTIAEDAGSGRWFDGPDSPTLAADVTYVEPYHAAMGLGALQLRLVGSASDSGPGTWLSYLDCCLLLGATGDAGSFSLEIDIDLDGVPDIAFDLPAIPSGEVNHVILGTDTEGAIRALVLTPGGPAVLIGP